jgi:beta-galactosidase
MQLRAIFLLLLLSCVSSLSHAQAKVDSNFHVYILLGQSNMAGRGEVTDEYRIQGSRNVLVLNKDGKWETAKHPLHFDKPIVAGVGPGLAFGIKMAETNSKIKIGLVPCAVGGTSINTWVPGGYDASTKTRPYDDALVRIKTAMQLGVVKGILWHQGESDAANATEYLPKLTALVTRLRTEIGNNRLPLVAAELGTYKSTYNNINVELNKLPLYLANTAVASSATLTHKGDSTHFDSRSATLLGERFAAQMQQILNATATVNLPGNAERIVQSINTNWQFHKGDINGLPHQNDTSTRWEEISLPHSWNTTDVLDDEPGYYRGTGWYKKTIYIPAGWKNKDVYIYFEGASQVADVFVNGQKVGTHIGGYNFFSFPIYKYLKYDANNVSANEIVVRVDNRHNEDIPPLSADFTFFGGIYRDVYLIAANAVHFDMDNNASTGVFITTPSVTAANAEVNVKGAFINSSGIKRNLLITTNIIDKSGKVIATKQTQSKANAGEKVSFSQVINDIKNPSLWSPEDPYLYTVTTTIADSKTKVEEDLVSNSLGFRWFEFDAEKGFFLNGKHYKLIGASRHQDFKDMANALPDAMHVRDVQLLKDMGANFLRVAHYPQDPAVLQACDRLGLLASVEIPIVNQVTESEAFNTNCKNMQVEMIRQSYNHPSVIMWAYMNEVLLRLPYQNNSPEREKYLKSVASLAQQLEDITRNEDPYRYTMIPNNGNFDLYHKAGLTLIPKIVGWNVYQGWYSGDLGGFARFIDRHHKELPNKPLLITEYGADADPRLHSLQPVRFDKSNEYAMIYHKTYLQAMMERPFVMGGAIWNLADFNSETRAEAMPHINNKGILTIDREAKDSYLFYKSHLTQKPFVAIGSQRWKLRAGIAEAKDKLYCTQPVEIYTNQKSITLKLNGKVLGTSNAEFGTALFNVPFVNGINKLEALAQGNNEVNDNIEIDYQLVPYNLKSTALPFTEINVSLGDKRIFVDDKLHQVWLPEKEYTQGSWGYIGGETFVLKGNNRLSYGSDKNILGTAYDPIYETQRVGIQQFKLDVPDGKYEVTLHFAELLSNKKTEEFIYNLGNTSTTKEAAANRSFSVNINNVSALENLSNANYLEPDKAYASKVIITVLNGEGITIDFTPQQGFTILNGLQVRKVF